MARQRFLLATAVAAAVVLSAPFVQQAFTAVSTAAGPRFRAIGIGATAVPVGVALLVAALRIRDRRLPRFLALASSLAIGAAYILIDSLSFAETFHFVEYGLLAWLFYRALPEIGVFRSRYTATDLAALGRDRAERWRVAPPVVLRRLSREDQYLTEGLWHVQRRNRAWNDGDVAVAWRENRILEKFCAPILDAPTYVDPMGHRWPAELRDDAARRPGIDRGPAVSDAYPYPLYLWPDLF